MSAHGWRQLALWVTVSAFLVLMMSLNLEEEMSEPYRCGTCGHGSFSVETGTERGKTLVIARCKGCCSEGEGDSLVAAFQAISEKKPEK